MKWSKSPEELVRRFNALLPVHPDAQPRKMFGYPACFVAGNFWIGLHQENVVVRLPDALHTKFPATRSAAPFDPMGGRPIKGWYVLPQEVTESDEQLGQFMRRSLEAVRKLPNSKSKTAASAKRSSKRAR